VGVIRNEINVLRKVVILTETSGQILRKQSFKKKNRYITKTKYWTFLKGYIWIHGHEVKQQKKQMLTLRVML